MRLLVLQNAENKGAKMIKVSVLYPNNAGSKFNMDYYCRSHVPMVQQRLGAACKGVAVEQGLAGIEPGSPAAFVAMGHLYFDSVELVPGRLWTTRRRDPSRHSQLHGYHPDSDQ